MLNLLSNSKREEHILIIGKDFSFSYQVFSKFLKNPDLTESGVSSFPSNAVIGLSEKANFSKHCYVHLVGGFNNHECEQEKIEESIRTTISTQTRNFTPLEVTSGWKVILVLDGEDLCEADSQLLNYLLQNLEKDGHFNQSQLNLVIIFPELTDEDSKRKYIEEVKSRVQAISPQRESFLENYVIMISKTELSNDLDKASQIFQSILHERKLLGQQNLEIFRKLERKLFTALPKVIPQLHYLLKIIFFIFCVFLFLFIRSFNRSYHHLQRASFQLEELNTMLKAK